MSIETVGVLPDFRAGRRFVDGRVGRVLELLQQHVLCPDRTGDFLGLGDCAAHALGAFGQHSSRRTRSAVAAFEAHGFRHRQRQRMPRAAATKASAMPVLPEVGFSTSSLPARAGRASRRRR
jgi:hypothetical protein